MPLTGDYAPSSSDWARQQADVYDGSDGAAGATLHDRPIVLVTHIGRRSGKLRKTPLMRVEHGGRYALIASQGGAREHPVWYHNLVAHPQIDLRDGADVREMTVRELDGPEREVWWHRAVAAFPNYATYQTRTDRLIPVMLAEPRDEADATDG